ncbi:AAA family ATPase [Clostridium botulinum]|uniref:HTH-type transcriptional regulatory protein TyrR n=1 Tax=Clostridium botulinum TaxID=1491 RepID=A0A6B4K9F1_CLOBO|nr:AAA family ATPase [Clostridium botulinum]NFD84853.1 AAA family ATPase [Clostridium botulinum]NFE09558.1 AAA family ATPase [Clostridium botulinum]NFE36062.1 AAA family ATPase [Clostridium botulinum]NFE50269.1 AAA family ATPase [Clostridium botulinum]
MKLEIITEDRLGMVLDILNVLYNESMDIKSLEVFPKKIYIKINKKISYNKNMIIKKIKNIKGVVRVKKIDILPYEKDEKKLFTIIDSLEEGVIFVNEKCQIDVFNKYCENLFDTSKENAIRKHIKEILGQNQLILDALKMGKDYDNLQVFINNKDRKGMYVSTARAIKDDKNKTIGFVILIKDLKETIEIVNSIKYKEDEAFKGIIGESICIDNLKEICKSVSKTNSTVLICGESGTGKELFAKAIYKLSLRNNKNFVTVNCAGLQDNLIESELFGYEAGSFTGAKSNGKEGFFKLADKGTIFLDEIGELPLNIQCKFLRVLQEGTIRKIGSTKEEEIDVRIIAATNKNLEEMVLEGKFREDLYYRLNVVPIEIPPLRERKEDIQLLVDNFVKALNKSLNKNIRYIDKKFINKLLKYNFPGNIRELQNIIERTMNLCSGNILSDKNLSINTNITLNNDKNNDSGALLLQDIVEKAEKCAIQKVMNEYKSLRKVGKVLGVSHTTVMNKIKKYGIVCK